MKNPELKEYTGSLELEQTYLGMVADAQTFEQTYQKVLLTNQIQMFFTPQYHQNGLISDIDF